MWVHGSMCKCVSVCVSVCVCVKRGRMERGKICRCVWKSLEGYQNVDNGIVGSKWWELQSLSMYIPDCTVS